MVSLRLRVVLFVLLVTGAQGRQWKDTEPIISAPFDRLNKTLSTTENPMAPSVNMNEQPSFMDVTEAVGGEMVKLVPVLDQIPKRKKRSEVRPDVSGVTCNRDITDALVSTAEEACNATRDIDHYISRVNSVSPVNLTMIHDEYNTDILQNYNEDLRHIQIGYVKWKRGDSIFNAIKETFDAVKGFGPVFNAAFDISKVRADAILSGNPGRYMAMQEEIERLQDEVKEIEAVMHDVSHSAIRNYFAAELKWKQKELERLMNNEDRVKLEMERDELIAFFELVVDSVGWIQSQALATATRVEELKDDITTDASMFRRYRAIAHSAVRQLQNKSESIKEEIIRLDREVQALSERIVKNENEVWHVRAKLETSIRELQDIKAIISSKLKSARDKQIAGSALLVIPVFGWIAGGTLLGVSVQEENRLLERKNIVINEYSMMIDSLYAQGKGLLAEIDHARKRIEGHIAAFHSLDAELSYFSTLDSNLDTMQKDISFILPSVDKALLSLARVKDVFDGLKLIFMNIIDKAKDGNLLSIAEFTFYNIDALKCQWGEAVVRIVPLGQCI